MRAALILLLAAAALSAAGCKVFTGYDGEDPVRLTVDASADLNTYGDDSQPHPVYLYFYKVSDRTSFNAAEAARLKAGESVPGVEAANPAKKAVHPNKQILIEISPMGQRRFSHLGVVVAFRNGSVKGVVKVPWTATLQLSLGPQDIRSFEK